MGLMVEEMNLVQDLSYALIIVVMREIDQEVKWNFDHLKLEKKIQDRFLDLLE
jgi:hypothetical protein